MNMASLDSMQDGRQESLPTSAKPHSLHQLSTILKEVMALPKPMQND